MPAQDSRERLVTAAFTLFDRQGFDATTVDQIAAAAGVGRSTFFRYFPSKEDVVFPQHRPILAAVEARLASASSATAHVALFEASAIVLNHYLEEGPVAQARYALTRSIPALRNAEIANQRDYQRVFVRHARSWGFDELDAELLASGVVTAHNHVLRRWLRGQSPDPRTELRTALDRLRRAPRPGPVNVVVLEADGDVDTVVDAVREALTSPRS